MTQATRFDLASLTKPLVTAPLCIAALERGLLSLDDPLSRFFPDSVPGDKERITVRSLLSHSSGLPAYEPFYLELIKLPSGARPNALASMILQTPLDNQPGKTANYSDLGFMLLGLILERQMGSRLDCLAQDILFARLGIDELHFCPIDERKTEDGGRKTEDGGRETEDGGRETEDGGRETEDGGRETEDGGRKTEDGGRKTEDGGRKTEDGGRRTEDGGRKTEDGGRRTEDGGRETEDGGLRTDIRSSDFRYAATQICPWRKRLLFGEVDDENAWTLNGVCGHAGLFGTARGVFKLLSFLWNIYEGSLTDPLWPRDLVRLFWTRTEVAEGLSNWCLGYDTPSREGYSSAGRYFSRNTIGHLGFTGVSFWLDLEKRILVILLTNRVHPTRQNDEIRQLRPVLHDIIMEALAYGN